MLKKKFTLGVVIALMALTAAITLSITYQYSMDVFNERIANLNERQQMYSKLSEIDQIVRNNYYTEIDEENLNDGIAQGYINGLDDLYSRYLSVEETKSLQDELSGEITGIGIKCKILATNEIEVAKVHAGSPADVAGFEVGDKIVQVDDYIIDLTLPESATQLVSKVAGELGSKVTIKVYRADATFDINVTRDNFEIQSVDYQIMDNSVGYIKIDEFNNTTDEQFTKAYNKLNELAMTGLVIDVRNNLGGTLDSVSKILDTLLPAGNIVSQTDKTGKETVLFTSDSNQCTVPIAVIVNGNTASAAELLACAISDYKKGTIVGEQTYGKGTMQQLIPLTDGSSVNVTIAKFNPPISGNFNGVGVTPDVTFALPDELKEILYKLPLEDDPQVTAAISSIYTLGGANPDVTVPQPDENTSSEEISSETVSSEDSSSEDVSSQTTSNEEGSNQESSSQTTSSKNDSNEESSSVSSSSEQVSSEESSSQESSSKLAKAFEIQLYFIV